MKILSCHNYYRQPGGEDRVFSEEVNLLRSRGHEVIEYTLHNDSIADMSRPELVRKTFWNRESAADIQSIIRRERPQVMQCTNTFPLISPSIYYAAREEGVPIVQWLQNFRMMCPKAQFTRNDRPCEKCLGSTVAWPALLHRCYRDSLPASAVVVGMSAYHWLRGTWKTAVDRFLVPTEFVKRKHIEGGVPADRIEVKPNFVHSDPGVGTGDRDYFVFVGRLSQEKGIDTLLQAWQRLPDDCRLKIVGQGPLAPRVDAAVARDPRIEWLGWRPLKDVLDVVGSARALVMPSTWYETFGRTIIEAYAKGTPVIASRLGAMAEIVHDGGTGLLFDPGDPAGLARRCLQVLRKREMAVRMGRSARHEYETKYTAEANYKRLLSIFADVSNCRPGASAEVAS